MKRKLKPWSKLSPSGKWSRRNAWKEAVSNGPDVFWNGDLFLPVDDLVVEGNLNVTGQIMCKTLRVKGNCNINRIISSVAIEIDGDLTIDAIEFCSSIIVKGDLNAHTIEDSNTMMVCGNFNADYAKTIYGIVHGNAYVNNIIGQADFEVLGDCDVGTIYGHHIKIGGIFTADNVYTRLLHAKNYYIFGDYRSYKIHELPSRIIHKEG